MIITYPDAILVQNLCQGIQGKFKISWKPAVLATGYNVYRSQVPYGTIKDLIAENIQETEFIDEGFDIIEGVNYYYAVSTIRSYEDGSSKESAMSRWQTAQNTNEYMMTSEGTWLDNNNMIYDPHSNKFPTSNQEQNYIGVNFLPLNVMRRTQFNYIQRHEMWILQDRGEPVYLLKRKKVNYSQPEDDDDRRIARSNRMTNDIAMVEFYEPLIIFAALASPGQTHIVYASGAALEKQTRSWTLYTPLLEDKDIIIDKENKRWEVQDVVRQRSWRGATTWQQFNIKALPITDPVYQNKQIMNVDGSKLYPKEQYWEREGI